METAVQIGRRFKATKRDMRMMKRYIKENWGPTYTDAAVSTDLRSEKGHLIPTRSIIHARRQMGPKFQFDAHKRPKVIKRGRRVGTLKRGQYQDFERAFRVIAGMLWRAVNKEG